MSVTPIAITAADLAAPGSLPPGSGNQGVGYNATLTAAGYGSISVRALSIGYGLNIIASESHAANTKAFYARKVLTDTFSMQIQFVSVAERRQFYLWALGYAAAAVSPSTVGLVEVTCGGSTLPDGSVLIPSFDMAGVLTSGMAENTATADVTWKMTLKFSGAQFANAAQYVNDSNIFTPPTSNAEAAKYFYPDSTALASTKPDALYASEIAYLKPTSSSSPAVSPVTPGPAGQSAGAGRYFL
jgi:hypothetical protein